MCLCLFRCVCCAPLLLLHCHCFLLSIISTHSFSLRFRCPLAITGSSAFAATGRTTWTAVRTSARMAAIIARRRIRRGRPRPSRPPLDPFRPGVGPERSRQGGVLLHDSASASGPAQAHGVWRLAGGEDQGRGKEVAGGSGTRRVPDCWRDAV